MIRTSTFLLVAAVVQAADIVDLPHHENQTVRREYLGDDTSIYWDLRLEPDGIRSGMMTAWPHAIGSVRVEQTTYEWAKDTILVNAPGAPLLPTAKPLTEDRIETTVTLRQALWTPFRWDAVLEVEGGALQRDATYGDTKVESNQQYLMDTRVAMLFPVYQERYAGLLLGGGVTLPTGDQEDWIKSHGTTGGLISARWSSQLPLIPWTTVGLMAEYQFAAGSENIVYPNDKKQHATSDYSLMNLGGRLGFRIFRDLSLGATARYERARYDNIQIPGLATTVNEEVYRYRAAGYLTWQALPQTFITGTASYSQGESTTDQESGFTFGIGLEAALW